MNLLICIAIYLTLLWVGLHGLVERCKPILPLLLLFLAELLWQVAHLFWSEESEFALLVLLLLLLLLLHCLLHLLLGSSLARLACWLALALRRLRAVHDGVCCDRCKCVWVLSGLEGKVVTKSVVDDAPDSVGLIAECFEGQPEVARLSWTRQIGWLTNLSDGGRELELTALVVDTPLVRRELQLG